VRELEKKMYAEDNNSLDGNDRRSSSACVGQEVPPAQVLPKMASDNPILSPENFWERGTTPDFQLDPTKNGKILNSKRQISHPDVNKIVEAYKHKIKKNNAIFNQSFHQEVYAKAKETLMQCDNIEQFQKHTDMFQVI